MISEKTSAANSNNKDNVLEFAINLVGTKGILSPPFPDIGEDMSPRPPHKIGLSGTLLDVWCAVCSEAPHSQFIHKIGQI